MGLAQKLRDAVDTALAAAGDVPKTVTYYSITNGSYDVATDTQTVTVRTLSCTGLVYRSKVDTQDYQKIDLIQTKVLISGNAFANAAVVPKEADYMVIEGVRYEIKSIAPAPSDALFIFVVRAV